MRCRCIFQAACPGNTDLPCNIVRDAALFRTRRPMYWLKASPARFKCILQFIWLHWSSASACELATPPDETCRASLGSSMSSAAYMPASDAMISKDIGKLLGGRNHSPNCMKPCLLAVTWHHMCSSWSGRGVNPYTGSNGGTDGSSRSHA